MAMTMQSAELSSRVRVANLAKPARAAAKAKAVPVCASADSSFARNAGKAATALALSAALALTAAPEAFAKDVQPYAGLTPCKTNAAFAKREKNEIKGLTKRLKNFEEGSAPALALNATIEKTKTRFKNYGEQGLLCGADGLPRLIVDGNLQHLGEFTYPGIGFLYVAGWIGYAGRAYVISNKETEKPLDGEIIIDVPKALGIMFSAAGWPLLAVRELQKGTLLEDDANITVSPR